MRVRSIAAAITCVVLVCAVSLSVSPASAQPPPQGTVELPQAPPAEGAGRSSDIPAPQPAAGAATAPRQPVYMTGTGLSARALEAQYAYRFTVLSIVIAAVIIGAFCFMYFANRARGEFSKHYIVIVVVVAAIFLLVMGYSEQQVAPAFGLLGTILGFVFGRAVGGSGAANGTPPPTPAPARGPTQPSGFRRERPATLAEMDMP